MLGRGTTSVRLSRRHAAVLAALLLAAMFVLLAHEATERELLGVDHAMQESLRAWRQPELEASMRALSVLGSGWLLVPLNALLVWLLWRCGHRNPLLIPVLTLVSIATEALLKWLVHRPRPKDVGYGFPSGHVMVSIVFFGLVLYLLWQARDGDAVAWVATTVGVVAVAAIGVSRIYLNAHWLSDVLGAIAGGLAFLIFAVLRLGGQICARAPGGEAPTAILPAVPRAPWFVVAAGAGALALVDVGTRVLSNNDEARFPVLAQSILGGGDWLVPTLNGAPYVNKPPLFAWAIVAASWPGGYVTPLTAVIPALLAGVLTVFVVYRLGREMWNPTTGRYAAAITATTQGLFVHARVPMPDMMLTAFVALSLWALHRMRRRRPGLAWLAFYAALAGGFWTKGPVGLMPLGVALAYALVRRRPVSVGWLRLAPGLPVLAALVAPWIIAVSLREAEAIRSTVAVDYVAWYLPQHVSVSTLLTPLAHLVSMALPWAWLLPFALYDAWRHRRGQGAERDAVVLLLLWIAVEFVMLALSQQQRVRYYLPLVAPLSLLLGWWLAGAVVQRRAVSLWRFRWTAAAGATSAAAVVVWLATHERLARDVRTVLPASTLQLTLFVVAAAVLVMAMEVGLRTQRIERLIPVAVVAAGVLVISLNHAAQQQHNAAAGYADVAGRAAGLRADGERVATIGIPALPVAFYLGEPVQALGPEALMREDWAEPGMIVIFPASPAPGAHAASITVVGHASLGGQQVAIGRVTGPLPPLPATVASTHPPRVWVRMSPALGHLAFELLCVVIAVAAVAVRTYALRRGPATAGVYAAEAIIILALASFPANAWVFGAGVVTAAACVYLRWRRPALADDPHVWIAVLLMLGLPLDMLEDLLQGDPVYVDSVWLVSALLGVALLTWRRLRPATA